MNENLVVPIFDLLKGDRDSKQITKLVKKILVANRRNIKIGSITKPQLEKVINDGVLEKKQNWRTLTERVAEMLFLPYPQFHEPIKNLLQVFDSGDLKKTDDSLLSIFQQLKELFEQKVIPVQTRRRMTLALFCLVKDFYTDLVNEIIKL